MKKIQAYQKYIRISPRKLKLLVDSIKDLGVEEKIQNLGFINKKAAEVLQKTLKQAVANAKQIDNNLANWNLDSIQVLKGPTYKRWRAVSKGRAHRILKRTSHLKIIMVLKEEVKNKNKKVKVVKGKKETENKTSKDKVKKSERVKKEVKKTNKTNKKINLTKKRTK